MTSEEFRELALSFPDATEDEHMGHPDFRVRGKIFATLGPPPHDWGGLKLTPPQQKSLVRADRGAFEPFPGAWGARGFTRVRLETADENAVRQALETAWCNVAHKRIVQDWIERRTEG